MILIPEFIDPSALALLSQRFEVHYDPNLGEQEEKVLALVKTAEALIVRNRTQVTARLLDAGVALKAVGRLGVGLDNIDLKACQERSVQVFPATGANRTSVVEYVLAAALLINRQAFLRSTQVVQGQWPREAGVGYEIADKTIGLIGFGGIAQGVARLTKSLGMHVCAHDPFLDRTDDAWKLASNVTLLELLDTCDVISVHVPLNANTRHMIGKTQIKAMKKEAILINTARGSIVDEVALAKAMREGHLRGAAMDVFAEEPLSHHNAKHFEGIDNLVLTPHIAGVTHEANHRVSHLIARRIMTSLEH